MSERSTLLNALIGGAVAVVFSFVPVSPAFGGAVAGYLEADDGLRVGAIAGLVAAVPFGFVALLIALFVLGIGPPELAVAVLLFFLLAVVYSVVLAAIGGLVGELLAEEYPEYRP